MVLAQKVDPQRTDKYGNTPMQIALERGHQEIVNMVVLFYPDISKCKILQFEV